MNNTNNLNLKRAYSKVNRTRLKLIGLTIAATATSTTAFADSAAAITAAIADGQDLVGLVGPGVIGIAALMLGVGIVVSWMRK